MRRILLVILVLFVLSVPAGAIFSSDYFFFDEENNKILFMGEKDNEFTEKIDMEKNPDRVMRTNDPQRYLLVFAPEIKKGKEKDARKGQLVLYNVGTGRSEDLVEMGYGPFTWVYTKDRNHLFITYRPELTSKYYELLHYDIAGKTTEKLADFSQKIDDLVLSYDERKVYALIPGGDGKTPGSVRVLTYSPLEVSSTISLDVNPYGLFVMNADKFVLIDADFKNRKKAGAIKIINAVDYSVAETYPLEAPYRLYVSWYQDVQTLFIFADTKFGAFSGKSDVFKITPGGVKVNEIPANWARYKYSQDKDSLYIMTLNRFIMIGYGRDKVQACDTGGNIAGKSFYDIEIIPDSNIVILYCPYGGKVKFIETGSEPIKMVKNKVCGRPGVRFGNALANFMVNVMLDMGSYNSYYGNGYYYRNYYYNVNLFRTGNSVAANPDDSKYYVLRRDTKDITVFSDYFEKASYIVPEEPPLTMYLIKKTTPVSLVVTAKKIYRLKPDDSLELLYTLKEDITDCLFFEEEKRLIILTDRDLIVMDSAGLEIKNDFMLYDDKDEKYEHLKKGEMRYYFIPAL